MRSTKKLGLFSATATGIGLIVATSCLVSLGTGVGLAGSGFVLPLAIAVILNVFVAFSFTELHSLMPNVEGGLGQYTATALGPVPSIISNVSAYVLCMAFAASAEAAMFGIVFTQTFFPGLNPALASAVLTILLLITNIRGIDMFAKIQNLSVVLLVGSLVVMAFISFFDLGTGQVVTAAAQTTPAITDVPGLAGLSALAFWLFIGIEFVIPISNDLKNPKRDVFLAMVIGLVILFVVQMFLGLGMTHYVVLSDLASAPMPHMLFAENLMGSVGKYWMGFVTIFAVVSTLNTVLASCTRIMAGMAQGGMLPDLFAVENKHNVPYAGIILLSVIIIATVSSGLGSSSDLVTVILTGACFWLVAYIITHINVLVLRKRYPAMERNRKLVLLGLPQVLGIIGCLYMIANISSDPDAKKLIFKIFGIALLILTVYSVAWVKFVMKKGIFEAVPIEEVLKGGPVAEESLELVQPTVKAI
ncbi:APC family permease [Desulfosporosinus sp. OT]|uniref:APC family permease n=1 Tax=Desulfosporosinus sp. OT TaxID=913865 RepID=UPI000223AB7B|nr:APC family permease [Desulfosporosinus sp. OT]EGW41827.1 amino acid permease family protein [Desulfosporosinus sp. OT]